MCPSVCVLVLFQAGANKIHFEPVCAAASVASHRSPGPQFMGTRLDSLKVLSNSTGFMTLLPTY